jgi:hypothetical protein
MGAPGGHGGSGVPIKLKCPGRLCPPYGVLNVAAYLAGLALAAALSIHRSRSKVIVPTAFCPARTALMISGVQIVSLSPSILKKRVWS